MTAHAPVPDYAAARRAMVDSQLRPQGVNDPRVLAAMAGVARERFVPEESRASAYSDRGASLGGQRHLAAPAVLGALLTALEPRPGERALVVGAGSGYSSAVLAAMQVDVTALESDAGLAAHARALGVPITEGPLEAGHSVGAPYDLILVDGAIENVPDALINQLAPDGRLGTALIVDGVTRLVVGRRGGSGFGYFSIGDAGVPPLPGFARPRVFSF